MGQNIGGNATWDDSQLQGITGGVSVGLRAPRTDLRPEENCYVALNNDRITVRGFIQVYRDGSAAYWFDEGTQGKLAANLDDAQRKLFAATGVGNATMSPLQLTHGAPALTSLKIQVEDLRSACSSSVSAGILQCYGEAASVMFDRFHDQSPAKGRVTLNGGDERPADFSWRPSTADEKASHANELDATEDGAYAVSFVAANRAAGCVVRKRAHHGSGSDWLMTRHGEPTNDFVRLEVSGIAKSKSLGGRLNKKVAQLGNGDLDRPGLAVVVGFEAAEVIMQEVKR